MSNAFGVRGIRMGIPLRKAAMWLSGWFDRIVIAPPTRHGLLAKLQFKEIRDTLTKVNALDFRVRWVLRLAQMWAAFHGAKYIRITDIDSLGIHMTGGPHYRKQAIDLGISPLPLEVWERFGDLVNGFLDYGRGYKIVVVGRHDSKGKHNGHVHIQAPPPFVKSGVVPFRVAGRDHAAQVS